MSLIQAQLERVRELIRSIEQTLSLLEESKGEGFYSESFFTTAQQQLGMLKATEQSMAAQAQDASASEEPGS